jgi:hypothetical protein
VCRGGVIAQLFQTEAEQKKRKGPEKLMCWLAHSSSIIVADVFGCVFVKNEVVLRFSFVILMV